ncbi:4-(cytidine 5'-diphospho)-2-C-methyl-D-erythritol kinase [Alphaproteobacteria bacterium]|nr:4-(cytidine 5'-diphospho)-2-C-methyl-D-erythritol kinase [Alphaproteobacteria bacterium]
MQNSSSEKAFAKINLSLNIINKRDDGYHNLNSDVIFANIYDSIKIKVLNTNNKNIDLKINGRFKKDLSNQPKQNIVYKAASYFMKKYNIKSDILITLNKNLPVASGIGGGSADAAATLRKLLKLFNINKSMFYKNLYTEIGKELGADIPVCLYSSALNIKNIGEKISNFPINLKKIIINNNYIILITPNKPISTKIVFNHWRKNLQRTNIINKNKDCPTIGVNDLKSTAENIEHSIIIAQKILSIQNGIKYFGMSGSGATCFGLFRKKNLATKAENKIKQLRPKWWVKSASIII